MPGKPPLEQLQKAELENLKLVVKDATTTNARNLEIDGKPARSWVTTFTLGKKHKRREVFVFADGKLFFLIADGVPEQVYDDHAKDIDALIASIRFGAGP